MAQLPSDIDTSTVIPLDNAVPAFNQDGFFFQAINTNLWNTYQPYQLVILLDEGSENYTVTPFRFTLPIPPQEISLGMPIVDTISATLTGYNEVHGGAPFRNINFSGSMGVIPEAVTGTGRDTVATGTQATSQLVGAIVGQVQQVASSVQGLTGGGGTRLANEYPDASHAVVGAVGDVPLQNTGYYYFHQLRQFLEGYLALKGRNSALNQGQKDDGSPQKGYTGVSLEPSKLRLGFCMWKDNAVYLVKLNNFEMRRTSESSLEYMYNLQMQAFKRINLKARGASFAGVKVSLPKKSVISSVLNAVDAARKTISGVGNIVNLGVVGTLATLSELARQVSGAIKDVSGIARNLIDMPTTFVSSVLNDAINIKQSAMAGYSSVSQTVSQFGTNWDQAVENKLAALGSSRQGPRVTGNATGVKTQAQIANTVQTSRGPAAPILINGQQSVGGSGGVGSTFLDLSSTSTGSINNAGIDPQDILATTPEVGDVNITTLSLSDDQKTQLDAEQTNSQSMTVSDFTSIRDTIRQNADTFAASIGSWDPTYNDTYGLATPTVAQRDPTRTEQDIIFSVGAMVQALDNFVVVLRDQGGQQSQPPNNIEYMASLAQQSGIDFRVPRSKYAISLPYGFTLEKIAQQYLGDANRWLEIAVLNNLQAPYIDEGGFDVYLSVNGSGSQITLPSSDQLFLGQKVWIASNTVRQEARSIVAILPNDGNSVTIALDGASDLDKLKIIDEAFIHTFLAGTVNSKQVIYLPNGSIPTVDEGLDGIPNINIQDPFVAVGGVDWLLTPKRDLVVTPYGDNPLAFGLTSVTQSVNVAFSTVKGALLQHPQWGFGPLVGLSAADFNIKQLMSDLQQFFAGDPVISGLQSATLQLTGDTLFVNANIGINGYDRGIPLLLSIGATR